MTPADGHIRPQWDDYFMQIAKLVGTRSSCDRGRVGCVIVKNKQILVTGYAGAPRGLDHCDEIGHQMKKVKHEDGRVTSHCLRTAHGEQNAIVQAARIGTPIEGATLYCIMTPCAACARMIINAGIKHIVCAKRYHAGEESENMFARVGISVKFLENGREEYARQ